MIWFSKEAGSEVADLLDRYFSSEEQVSMIVSFSGVLDQACA